MSRKWVPDFKFHLSLFLLLFFPISSIRYLACQCISIWKITELLSLFSFSFISKLTTMYSNYFWKHWLSTLDFIVFLRHTRLVCIIGHLLSKYLLALSDSSHGYQLLTTELPASPSASNISFWITQAPFSIPGHFLSHHLLLSFLKMGLLDDAIPYFLYSPL